MLVHLFPRNEHFALFLLLMGGKIASLVFTSLTDSEPASSTIPFGCYLWFFFLHFCHTPMSHRDISILLPTICLNLTLSQPFSRSTKGILQQPDHKWWVSNKIGSRHSQVHQASLFQPEFFVSNTILSLQVHHPPLKLSSTSH